MTSSVTQQQQVSNNNNNATTTVNDDASTFLSETTTVTTSTTTTGRARTSMSNSIDGDPNGSTTGSTNNDLTNNSIGTSMNRTTGSMMMKIKPTRKKRKASTVLAVGASRDTTTTNRSFAVTTTTTTSTATNSTDASIGTSGAIVTNDASTTNYDVTDKKDIVALNSDHSQQQHPSSSISLHPNQTINTHQSHMPLELIPPRIPENNTGTPSLRMFCTSYPAPKKPRRTMTLRSTGTTVATTATGLTPNPNTTLTTPTVTTPTEHTTAMILQNHTTGTNTNHFIHPSPLTAVEPPHHAGPIVQIVNGEIVLQESSMVFHGSVLDAGGNTTSATTGTSMNHFMGADGSSLGITNHGYDGIHDYSNTNSNNNALMTVVEEEAEMAVVGATYTSFATGRRARPNVSHWTVEETQLFYEALQQVGMDFGTMEAYFEAAAMKSHQRNNQNQNDKNTIRFRQRRQLKRKYQAEYNKNPKLMEKVLQSQGRVGIDLSVFHLSEDVVHDIVPESVEIPLNGTTATTAAATTRSRILEERNDTDTDVELLNHVTTNDALDQNDTTLLDEGHWVDHDMSTTTITAPLLPLANSSTLHDPDNIPNAVVPPTGHPGDNNRHPIPPKILNTKSKTIRPLRSAASRRMKQNKGK